MAAQAKLVPFLTNPTIVEALAAWEAVRFYLDNGLERVVLEGDALVVVNALSQFTACWSSYGHLIDDTKLLQE